MTELYMREMSVTEFFYEFGGSSLGNLYWHFQTLVEHGWLRKVRTKQGVRGRPQVVYRSTELAYYDDECAEEQPTSVREAFSTRILQQMGERIACARAASVIDSRADRSFWLDSTILDERGWSESIDVLNGCLRALAQEQLDARVRMAASGDPAALMMVALAGFESPTGKADNRASRAGERPAPKMELDLGMALETRLAMVFGDPMNIRIVKESTDVAMSPSELENKLSELPEGHADRRCKHLEKYGWIARVEEKTGGPRRGAQEVYYRATRPPADVDLWPTAARSSGSEESAQMLQAFYERVVESIKAGVFDARANRYLTWSALLLDEPGWRQVTEFLKAEQKRLIAVQRQANQRLRAEGQPCLLATFFSAAFEIPPFGAVPS